MEEREAGALDNFPPPHPPPRGRNSDDWEEASRGEPILKMIQPVPWAI